MAQRLDIAQTCTALTQLLKSTMSAAYKELVEVKESSTKDFNDNGELILKKVAIRVRFGSGDYSGARDITRTTKSASLAFEIVCRHESLRSSDETRNRTLQLVGCVQEQVAGARLQLANGTISEPIDLVNVLPVADAIGPVEECYAVGVQVSGFAQFSGVNAKPAIGGA